MEIKLIPALSNGVPGWALYLDGAPLEWHATLCGAIGALYIAIGRF